MKFSTKLLALIGVAAVASPWTTRFASADCECSTYYSDGNAQKPFDVSVKTLSYSNVALEVMHIALSTIDGTRAEPHKIAMITSAMYEQYAVYTGATTPLEATPSGAVVPCDDECEDAIVKAGYFALKMVLTGDAIPLMLRRFDKLALVDAKLKALGYDCTELDGMVTIVRAILMKYNIFPPAKPMSTYYTDVAVNPASGTFDADCGSLVELDKWQAQCVQVNPGEDCKAQSVPFLPLEDARLISTGDFDIEDVIDFGEPPALDDLDAFLAEHSATLAANAALTDVDKFSAEYFAPNGAVIMQQLAIDEAEARGLSLEDSIVLLFAVGGGVRDSIVGVVTQKLTFDTIRPVTVLQCASEYSAQFKNFVRFSEGWGGPYQGNKELKNGKYRPYLQTPPFPGFPSGHSVAAGAAAKIMELFFDDSDDHIQGGNCAEQKEGNSKIEPKILKGATGYIEGITDVANTGTGTKGYSPASDLQLCWETFHDYASALSDSRLMGGIHIPMDNSFGINYGEAMGEHFYEYIATLL